MDAVDGPKNNFKKEFVSSPNPPIPKMNTECQAARQ